MQDHWCQWLVIICLDAFMRNCHNNPYFSVFYLNYLWLAIHAVLERPGKVDYAPPESSVADHWLVSFARQILLCQKQTQLHLWLHKLFIYIYCVHTLVIECVLAEHIIFFLTIWTIVRWRIFIPLFQRNSVQGYHNLLQQLFHSCLTLFLTVRTAVLIATAHTT